MYSLLACLLICIVLVQHRYRHLPEQPASLVVTNWDAFGYYMYLPSMVIYDYKQMDWVPAVDAKYRLTGGDLYQAQKNKEGKYFFKYLGGVALLQSPFFLLAHQLAPSLGYPQDGFSAPYQFAIMLAALFYAMLGILLLRRLLLRYFEDRTVAIVLLLMCLATNLIQYAAVDSGMSHIYIFPLYAIIMLITDAWHRKPAALKAFSAGYIIGLATICRPTEALMLFIPLLWDTHTKEAAKQKWQKVREHRPHVWLAIAGGFIGILPQLIYWKSATGSWIYDVGSAWDFLTPHLRVLIGWEKGWFIYTPVTVFFVAGLFFLKPYRFRKSVLWFCLLNIYIIIAWRDWQYGGSYSTRALVQSYPVFALAFGALIQHIQDKKWRWLFYAAGIYLVFVNLFQLEQYADNILHYRDMNRKYYSAIYLDNNPTPADMSLLDNNSLLTDEDNYHDKLLKSIEGDTTFILQQGEQGVIYDAPLLTGTDKDAWLVAKGRIYVYDGFWQGYLNIELIKGDSVNRIKSRLFTPVSKDRQDNDYELHAHIPDYFKDGRVRVYLNREEPADFDGTIKNMQLLLYTKE